jgi:hypothetical protein
MGTQALVNSTSTTANDAADEHGADIDEPSTANNEHGSRTYGTAIDEHAVPTDEYGPCSVCRSVCGVDV